MNKLFSGAQLHWVDQIALLAGRRLDLVYASLIHQLRLSPGFFRQGWGDLGVVNFEEDAKLFKEWPPPHFDQQVRLSVSAHVHFRRIVDGKHTLHTLT